MVGVAGFEPATPSSRTRCSTRLSHTPTDKRAYTIAILTRQAGAKAAEVRSRLPVLFSHQKCLPLSLGVLTKFLQIGTFSINPRVFWSRKVTREDLGRRP